MKYFILFLTLSISFCHTFAQDYNGNEPYLVKNLDGLLLKQAEVKTNGGNISVYGNEGKNRIEVYISSNHGTKLSREEIQSRLDKDYTLNITLVDGKLLAEALTRPGFKNWNKGLSISFKIYSHPGLSCDLKTSGGNLSLKNLNGAEQKLSTSGGNIELDQITGNLLGVTSGGNIDMTGSSGKMDIITSGGNLNIQNCKGNMSLRTSGGNILLQSLSGNILASTSGGNIDGTTIQGNLDGKTSGGNVNLKNLSGSLDCGTTGGEMNIEVKKATNFIKVNNTGGNIHLALPDNQGFSFDMTADKIHFHPDQKFKGILKEGNLKGDYNNGGIPVSVNSGGGDIHLQLN